MILSHSDNPAEPNTMLKLPASSEARRLYEFFLDANYTEEGLYTALDTAAPPLPQLRNMPQFLDRTRQTTRFNHLVRWFLLSLPVEREAAAETIPKWFLQTCLDIGMLRLENDGYAPNVLMVPYGQMLIASDPYAKLESATPFDHVLTVNPAARHLLNFTIRKPEQTTLDLGTGCGIQALAAATHSEDVVATDLNPRATAYAEFNARLNGFDNIQCYTGDLFAPVEGRRFDLIVSNPPFVLAPSKRFLYRDNDMELDQFCRQLAREAPAYLNEGGYFQMICEWINLKGQTWQERVAEWFKGAPCDVWVLKHYTRNPWAYAQTRLRETFQDSPEQDAATYAEWMDYYRREGVEMMHGGLITMRRRSKGIWLKIEELNETIAEPVGDAILQRFAARDFLEAHAAGEQLLAVSPRLSPQVRLEQECEWSENRWRTLSLRLRLTKGLRHVVGVDKDVADFLAKLDGKHTLGQLIEDLTAQVEAEPAQVRTECLGVVRLMIERGFLLP